MKNHHEVGHFKNRLMIGLLSLSFLLVMAGQSFAAMNCSSCHGMPPLDGAERSPSSGAFKGDHQKHMGAAATPSECSKCHGNSGYATDHAATSGFMIKINSNINSSSAGATYSKGNSFAQTSTPALGSCSNVNCHFETVTPVWGTRPVTTDCNSCHATPRAGSGSHAKHEAAYGGTASCTQCHPNYGTTNFSHATSAGKHKIVVNTILNYAGGTAVSWLPSQSKSFGTCSNVSCHSNGRSVYNNPTWGTANTVGCAFCHPNLSGAHAAHIGSLLSEVSFYAYTSNKSTAAGYKFGCANCHPLTVASHLNESVDVVLAASASGGSLKAKNGAWAYDGGTFKCDNIYCHSNGLKPTYTFVTSPSWFGSISGDRCAACHGNSPTTGAHTAHAVGIHYDDIFNGVSKKLPLAGGNSVNAAHGANSRSTTINCNICHSATVTSFANDKNPACSSCHQVGGSPAPLKGDLTIADASMHVNGVVDVKFINQKISTKAQVGNSAFAAYTANSSGGWSRNSNGMNFKTYTSSYDTTKTTLFAAASPYTSAAGCLNIACHAGNQVKWTDTITCTGCHTRLK